MTNLTGQSRDILGDNIEKLKALFPEVECEGKVDFEKLRQILGEYVDDSKERYDFRWNGKGRALRFSQIPSMGTLQPCAKESKDWDTTENLYIEGDNLEVLKLLQKSYHGKVKMIYIDPPYNTGGDFVYPDNYHDSLDHYKKLTGQVDEDGKKLSTNSESNGRYHTDWLNMMYPRLRLARSLLTDDGVIFMSIDDNEVDNLRKICSEIFGERNLVSQVIWEKKYTVANDARFFSDNHDHILCYCKSIDVFKIGKLPRTDEMNAAYKNPDNHPKGPWKATPLHAKSGSASSADFKYIFKNGSIFSPPQGTFSRYSVETLRQLDENDEIWCGKDGTAVPSRKTFLAELKNEGIVPRTIIPFSVGGHNHEAVQELKMLIPDNVFNNPKPTKLLRHLCTLAYLSDTSIVLDFFSGSATTAHAVMQLNAEDGGNRKFICVQLPEPTDEKSEAYNAGFTNICEIGKERIRRAGEKIKAEVESGNQQLKMDEEPKKVPDIGFKVLKLDTSNLKKWQPDYDDLETSMYDMVSNFVDGRTQLDVVYEIMVKMGLPLTLPVETWDEDGTKIYTIGGGMLMICLADAITQPIAHAMVRYYQETQPELWKVVCKDNGFPTDTDKVNIIEILKAAGLEEDAFTTI